MSTVTREGLTPSSPEMPSRLAQLLRWLGTAAVALSGILFLLQGLEDMDAVIRNWSYLLLMAVITVCGVGTHALLGDARSARLLLGLAVGLVPIQFAQLGGMLYTWWSGEVSVLPELFGFHAASPVMILAVAAATLAAAPLVSFAGFSVLVRPSARSLTFGFLLPNAMLLLPWRDSVAGFAVLALIAALVVLLDHHLARSSRRFATPEGRAVRVVFLLPVAIAAARLAFHVEALAGYCTLAGFAALALACVARHLVANAVIREMMYLASALLAGLAWMAWAALELQGSDFIAALVLAPTAAIFLAVGRISGAGRAYRFFASAFVCMSALLLCAGGGIAPTLVALGLGTVLAGYGCLCREREPTLAGAAVMVGAVAMLGLQAWVRVEVNGWLALATAGILLVLCASVVERFGRALLVRARDGWTDVCQWS